MKIEELPDLNCALCGKSGVVRRLSKPTTVVFRGERIKVVQVVRQCGSCGNRWENGNDPDWRRERNRIYLRRTGLDPRSDLKII
jgi:hypothetical protein